MRPGSRSSDSPLAHLQANQRATCHHHYFMCDIWIGDVSPFHVLLLSYILTCVFIGNLGLSLLISVLFETPSGFAIFNMLEDDLKRPDAMQVQALLLLPPVTDVLMCLIDWIFQPNFCVSNVNSRMSGQTSAWIIGLEMSAPLLPSLPFPSDCYCLLFCSLYHSWLFYSY